MASHVVVLDAIYYDSTELSATDFCFMLHQDTIPDPMLRQYLEVLFLSTELPAQSAFVNPLNLMSSPQVYFNSSLTFPHTYLRMCLAAA